MSTGDLKNNIKKLQTQIKAVKYTGKLDLEEIKDGSPTALLPLYHYVFTSYSHKLNKDIANSNNELYGKSDLRFIEAIYKILRDMFSYKPPVTREQFFLPGFAERKVIMATEILRHIHSAYNPPSSASSYKLASKLERKQHEIHTKVQENNQNEHKAQSKPRKVAGKTNADLSEAIVLPRYISSSHHGSWREPRTGTPGSHRSTTDISETDSVSHHVQPKSPPPTATVDETTDRTLKFTEHITNTLAMLNLQVGKISNALQKVETRVAAKESPRAQEPVLQETPSQSDRLKMDTLMSKVILLENRMTLLDNKVDDIQNFCAIMLENRNNNSNNNTESCRQSLHSPASGDKQVAGGVGREMTGMHPSFVNAFAAVADLNVNVPNRIQNPRANEDNEAEEDDNDDNDDEITIEDVVARDNNIHERIPSQTADMKFMKSLVGPNDSSISLLREQADSSAISQESVVKNQECKTKTTQPQNIRSFENNFSPIRRNKDTSLVHCEDTSLIHIPFAGVEEDEIESRRLSSTPNKADLDTSTISRVHRIMQMMKETQQQFQTEDD